MRRLLSLLIVTTAAANAQVVEFEFTATIYRIFEHDHAANTNTDVTFSDLSGFGFSHDQEVTGRFSYDPLTTPSPFDERRPMGSGR